MKIFKLIIFLIGAGVTACSFSLHKSISSTLVPVNKVHNSENTIDSLVKPYSLAMESEMNQKIAFAEVDFINERMNGNLGNMVSSVLLEEMEKKYSKNAICVLNFGGLRSSINKGEVKLADAFKLLPFDNYIVLVKFKASIYYELRNWILKNEGQPIAGFLIEQGKLLKMDKTLFTQEDFWVVTSDYLLNGGDNATFFQENIEVIETGLLLRDVFIEGITGKTLKDNQEKRIAW